MGSLVGGILGLIGGSEQEDAAQAQAQGQADAARIAAEASAFRPVGLTTRFGKSGYTYDANGNIIGAGYQVAPDLAAMREGMLGMAGGSLSQAQQMRKLQPFLDESATNLFKLGTQALPQTTDINQLSKNYVTQQQGLLQPQREQDLARVRNSLQQAGRGGLAFGATQAGNRAATNPEMAAYYNSLAQQDAQIAANAVPAAQQQVQNQINMGAGLMGTGINTVSQGYGLQTAALEPWRQYMQGAQNIEGMGAGAMDMSSALGAKTSTAGANQAQYLARTNANTGISGLGSGLMGLANNSQFTSGLGNLFSNFGTAGRYGTTLGSQQTNMLAAQDSWFR